MEYLQYFYGIGLISGPICHSRSVIDLATSSITSANIFL